MGRRRRVFAAAAAGALLLAPAAGSAALPDELTADAVGRGVLLAFSSVYRLEVTVHVDALETRAGRRLELPRPARVVRLRGTAFAVAPGGYLVAAGHVADPTRDEVAAAAQQAALAAMGRPHADAIVSRWVRRSGARPVGERVQVRRLTAARPGGRVRAFPGRLVRADPGTDLALLQIPAPRAPALLLSDAATRGTAVAVLGFGDRGGPAAPEPAVLRGQLAQSGLYPPSRPGTEATAPVGTVVTAPVRKGDSGAPVVDGQGRVRGVVLALHRLGGIMEDASEVRALLARADVDNARGHAGVLFAAAMGRLWRFDLAGARRGLGATLHADPQHALAGREIRRVDALIAAPKALEARDRTDGALRALALASAVAAAACGALLVIRRPAPGGRRGVRRAG